MKFRIEHRLEDCQKLWQIFAGKKELFDQWEYRDCFYRGYGYEPYFIVGFEGEKIVGLLPLWREKKRGFYTFFGGTFPEPNYFWIKNKEKIGEFLNQCPKPTRLYYIDEAENKYCQLTESETKFFLDLGKYGGKIENYFMGFGKKHRKNIKYDLKQFEKINYKLRYNQLEDLEKMVELNQGRFGRESDFNEAEMQLSLKMVAEIAQKQKRLGLISLLIDGKVEAVEMAVIWGNCYYILASGHNLAIANIGKKMMVEHINRALEQKIMKLDFLSSDSGWKKGWHLEGRQLFEFKN